MGRAKQPWMNPDSKVFKVFVNGRARGPLCTQYFAKAQVDTIVASGTGGTVEVRGQQTGGGWKTVVQYKDGERMW